MADAPEPSDTNKEDGSKNHEAGTESSQHNLQGTADFGLQGPLMDQMSSGHERPSPPKKQKPRNKSAKLKQINKERKTPKSAPRPVGILGNYGRHGTSLTGGQGNRRGNNKPQSIIQGAFRNGGYSGGERYRSNQPHHGRTGSIIRNAFGGGTNSRAPTARRNSINGSLVHPNSIISNPYRRRTVDMGGMSRYMLEDGASIYDENDEDMNEYDELYTRRIGRGFRSRRY